MIEEPALDFAKRTLAHMRYKYGLKDSEALALMARASRKPLLRKLPNMDSIIAEACSGGDPD